MAEYPYLFREMCAGAAIAAGFWPPLPHSEIMFVAEARRAWVLKHGAMIISARGIGMPGGMGGERGGGDAATRAGTPRAHVLVQHVEYHSLEAPGKGAADVQVEFAERVVNVAQAHAHNYYHFLCEVVPRLLMVPRAILYDPRTKILLPPLPSSGAAGAGSWSQGGGGFVGGLLHMLGLPESCVLGGVGGRAQGAHTRGGLVFGLQVLFPSYSPYLIHSQTPRVALLHLRSRLRSALHGGEADRHEAEGGWHGNGVWANEREGYGGRGRLDAGVAASSLLLGPRPRRVLVSVRGGGSNRGSEVSDVQNWAEFVPVLGRGASVETLEPGTLSLQQQAAAFSRASAVLGAHGSNLANIVWLQQGGAVVEVHRPAHERGPRYNNFWHMAGALGLRYRFVVAAPGFLLTSAHADDVAQFLGSLETTTVLHT